MRNINKRTNHRIEKYGRNSNRGKERERGRGRSCCLAFMKEMKSARERRRPHGCLKLRIRNLGKVSPPSSSESLMNVSCMVSGATTRYFSSVMVVVVVVTMVSVTTLRVSMTEMYPSFWAIDNAVCPCCNRQRKHVFTSCIRQHLGSAVSDDL